MKKGTSLVFLVLIVFCGTAVALAQSSGSFSATGTPAACAISQQNGNFSGGTQLTAFTVSVQTSNGNGVSLLIRPSLVTGLFTETKISTEIPTATADVGIQVCVDVDNTTAPVYPSRCITFDQRFQQISSNLFSQLEECTNWTDPETGLIGLNPNCDFDLILSTLSAHSFDFVVPNIGQGDHAVKMSWVVTGAEDNISTKGSKGAACVGPGMLTVTQVKNFSQNSAIQLTDEPVIK